MYIHHWFFTGRDLMWAFLGLLPLALSASAAKQKIENDVIIFWMVAIVLQSALITALYMPLIK